MRRYRICKLCGDMHDMSAWPDNHRDLPPQRSALPSPYFISDIMDDMFHPVNSRTYDSKSEFRRITEASGNIEIGTDEPVDRRVYDTVTDSEVAQAKQMVDQGYIPRPEVADADDLSSVIA